MFQLKRKELVEKLKKEKYIKSDEVESAFLIIPREEFVPELIRNNAYVDSPLEIGNGQTISAPHMVAIMCEALDIKKGQKILEIGTGLGYHAAIVSRLVGDKGHVFSVERFSSLAQKAKENLKSIKINNVTVKIGDGSKGLINHAPFDCIYVTCAAPLVPPPLFDQLNNFGKLLIPVGKLFCNLTLIEKINNKPVKRDFGGCAFVPLVGQYGY